MGIAVVKRLQFAVGSVPDPDAVAGSAAGSGGRSRGRLGQHCWKKGEKGGEKKEE
jgi:hypothetical protein